MFAVKGLNLVVLVLLDDCGIVGTGIVVDG
jgi:hypothetical protein